MLIAQISDCHIVEPGGLMADRADPADGLRAAVALINALDPQPDLVVASGDLVNDGLAAQYDHLMDLLSPLRAPVVAIPGNHDDRSELRRRFAGLPHGGPHDPLDYVIDGHEVRLICLDTTIPGSHAGQVTAEQMGWLDQMLADQPTCPTIIVQHHPPFPTGLAWMDRDCGFTGAELEAEVLGRHTNVEAVISGHLHRPIHRRFAGTVASTCPSTAVQLEFILRDEQIRYTNEPGAVAVHAFEAGALNSHLLPIVAADRWVPSWADVDTDPATV